MDSLDLGLSQEGADKCAEDVHFGLLKLDRFLKKSNGGKKLYWTNQTIFAVEISQDNECIHPKVLCSSCYFKLMDYKRVIGLQIYENQSHFLKINVLRVYHLLILMYIMLTFIKCIFVSNLIIVESIWSHEVKHSCVLTIYHI